MNQTSQATNAVSDAQRGLRYRVLIVEDDADIRELIRYNLVQEGFIVEEAADGAQALEKVKRRVPDLMVLDLMLPGMPGLQVCRQMRAERETAHLPILIVTAKGTEVDKVLGLEMGADDYVVKPFSPRELVARIKAVLRRSAGEAGAASSAISVQWGPLRIDLRARCATVNDQDLELTGAEMRILEQLMRADAKTVTRDELMTQALGRRLLPTDRSLDTHVSNLRRKLAKYTERVSVQSVRGTGYALALSSERTATIGEG